MLTPIAFSLAVLLSLCHAQCNLEELGSELVSVLSQAGHIPESDPTMFNLQNLTNLCFVRSATNNTVIYQMRVSLLYSYGDVAMNQSAQATLTLCVGDAFMFTTVSNVSLTQDPHLLFLILNMATGTEDCQNYLDYSTFGSPALCSCKS